jgi:HCOMODA/2-hydroxy-3-carboxy-muconic semialdehyde decarboxylase
MGCYFGAGAALWDDPQLIRDDDRASAVVSAMGNSNAIVMRGNGVVVAAGSLEQAVALTWYLEDAARLELTIRAAGLEETSAVLNAAERDLRATGSGGIFERMWEFLTAGDPELQVQDPHP